MKNPHALASAYADLLHRIKGLDTFARFVDPQVSKVPHIMFEWRFEIDGISYFRKYGIVFILRYKAYRVYDNYGIFHKQQGCYDFKDKDAVIRFIQSDFKDTSEVVVLKEE